MKTQDFCYWLQGYFELSKNNSLNVEQTDLIKTHLNMVFKHDIDPKMGDNKHQQELNDIHNSTHLMQKPRC